MAFQINNLAAVAHSDMAAPDAVDVNVWIQGFAGSGVVSGCAVTPSAGLTVAIASGVIMVAGATVVVTGTTKTSAAAHATLNRFDLVVVDNAGTVTIQGGTASATPAFPVVPANSIALASLFIGAAQITTSAAEITDKRVVLLNTMNVGVSTGGNTLGNTGVFSNRVVLVGGSNITLSGSSQSGSYTMSIHGATGSFSGGISTGGNTSGTTGFAASQMLFVGGNNITLSQSINAQSLTLTFSAGTGGAVSNAIQDVSTATGSGTGLSQFAAHDHVHRGMRAWNVQGVASTFFGDIQYSAGANITLNTGGNTTAGSIQIVGPAAAGGTISMWRPGGYLLNQSLAQTSWGNSSMFFFHDERHGNASASVADFFISATISTSSNSSFAAALSLQLGYYTANGSTLSLASSGSQSYQFSNTSDNSLTALVGIRRVTIPINLNLTPGDYWVGYLSKTATTNANWATIYNEVYQSTNLGMSGDFLVGATSVTNWWQLGYGNGGASAALPASIAFSKITGSLASSTLPAIVMRNLITP